MSVAQQPFCWRLQYMLTAAGYDATKAHFQ